jgi:Reverse transcriptase (RNA-dependent DNA polymerase)
VKVLIRRPAFRRARQDGPDVHSALADPARYEQAIDRLHQRHLFDGGLERLTQGEVSLGAVVMHRDHVARLLARTVAAGGYRMSPATLRSIRVEGKRRDVFSYPVMDLIVGAVVADVLSQALEPTLSANLYSYRAGVSWWTGVAGFAHYVREHRAARPDPRTRGLYVLRRDIDAYTDSIPLTEGSAIWDQVWGLVGGLDGLAAADRTLIDAIVRPTVQAGDGGVLRRDQGVATGQPISCVCFNLNLRDLDQELEGIPGAFVARYSDDLIVAHPDPDVCRQASEMLDRHVAALGLRFNQEKRHDWFLSGSGRASEAWPEARGTTAVTFLGMRVNGEGTIALGHRKAHGLLEDARRRAANTARATQGATEDERGRAVVAALRRLLDAEDAALQGSSARLLARAITDRPQLESLDRELAGITASAVTGIAGPAAFRRVPYRTIRQEWGLPSLRRARDRNTIRQGPVR